MSTIAWDDMTRLMRVMDIPAPRTLRCGHAAWHVLRAVTDKTTDVLGLNRDDLGALGLYGIPVHVDPDMPDGAWCVMEGDDMVSSGDFAPGHRRAVFFPGTGMILGFSEDMAALMDRPGS